MPNGMIQPGRKFLDLLRLPSGPMPRSTNTMPATRVREKQVAVRRRADQTRLRERDRLSARRSPACSRSRCIGVEVATGIQRHLEARRRGGPCVLRTRDQVRPYVTGFFGLRLRQVSHRDLVAHAGLLLVVVGEGSLPSQHGSAPKAERATKISDAANTREPVRAISLNMKILHRKV